MEINIAVLDDIPVFCDALESELKLIQKNNPSLQLHIDKYQDAATFLAGSKELPYQLFFLDIELGSEQNGIDIAKKLRDMDGYRFAKIVFISSHPNYAIDLFPIYPFSFLVKGTSLTAQLTDLFDRYLSEQNQPEAAMLPFKSGYIACREILYLECYGHLVTLHCKNGFSHSERIDVSFKSYCEKLKSYGFIQIHQSYCVNESEIHSLSGNRILLTNGTQLDISRSYRQSCQKRLQEISIQEDQT